MNRYICIHGHFYQPPRENPWLDEVELQESAFPYHDWNERVSAECYGRNASARILDHQRRITDIVNNYARISFNFGPTLLAWMERKMPQVYAAVLEADKLSQQNFNGHGSAIAQVYNHIIMPLANSRDKRTQVLWGIRDFESRFKRKPEGMWLAETAVDLETLDIMAEQGIKFTILAPNQARRVKESNQDMLWRDVGMHKVDPRVGYKCYLPSGRIMNVFFYDGPIAQGVAFEGLLNNGEAFAQRLIREFNNNAPCSQLVHVATDGETYGHHHKFGDMALAYCLHYIRESKLAQLSIYADFLERCPPVHDVEINEFSSWSCAHGVERWRSNCGCCTGGGPGWHQEWRKPLRDALDFLRDKVAPVYEQSMSAFVSDPWAVRDNYIDLILNRSRANIDAFVQKHASRPLNPEEKILFLKLLEMQYNTQLMYTSCGWFFNDISGIETVQILQYAARVIQLAHDIGHISLEEEFVEILSRAKSNLPEYKDGAHVFRQLVRPLIVDLSRVGAHYAVTSLFAEFANQSQLYAFNVDRKDYLIKEAGRLRLAVGHIAISSNITLEQADVQFAVLHLGDHNFIGGVDRISEEDYQTLKSKIRASFAQSNIPETIGLINRYFGSHNYSLWDLFKQEQQKILNLVLKSTMDEIETSFEQIYEHHYPLMQIKNEIRLPLPRMLTTVVEFMLVRDISGVLQAVTLDIERLKTLAEELKRWAFKRDQANLSYLASGAICRMMNSLKEHPEDVVMMEKVSAILDILNQLQLELDIWEAQNAYFFMGKAIYKDILSSSYQDDLARRWIKAFELLGEALQVKVGGPS